MTFRIAPISDDFLMNVRRHSQDDQNQPVERMAAAGGEPCRDVLRRARPGEPLILASYCPFTRPGPYKEYGPIFVLAEPSAERVDYDALAAPNGDPGDYLREQFVLRAYDAREAIAGATLTGPARYRADLEALFEIHRAAFVLVRFPAYGCYGFRIEKDVDPAPVRSS